jgi:hypothetical protein
MMINNTQTRGIAAGLALAILAGQAAADPIHIRSNTVVPVVMEDELSFKESREGDRFRARVRDSRDLPSGSRLEGRIINIERARGDRPAYMDVEFTTLLLPDGTDTRISAVPISLDSKYLSRERDGRLVAKKGALRKDHYVWGGVIGGAILGSIIGRKTFEGAFVGAIAGIIVAESQAKQEHVALKKGTEMGALFEREVRVDFNGRWDTNDPRNDSRNDRYNDDRKDDRYDYDRREDRYGNERREDVLRRDPYRDDYDMRIEFNGRPMRFGGNEQPYRMGNSVMVPLERAASQMSLDVQISGRTILVEDDDSILKLEQDSDAYRLNGKRGIMPRNVVKRGNTIYVPLEVLAAMKREAITVDGTRVRLAQSAI